MVSHSHNTIRVGVCPKVRQVSKQYSLDRCDKADFHVVEATKVAYSKDDKGPIVETT